MLLGHEDQIPPRLVPMTGGKPSQHWPRTFGVGTTSGVFKQASAARQQGFSGPGSVQAGPNISGFLQQQQWFSPPPPPHAHRLAPHVSPPVANATLPFPASMFHPSLMTVPSLPPWLQQASSMPAQPVLPGLAYQQHQQLIAAMAAMHSAPLPQPQMTLPGASNIEELVAKLDAPTQGETASDAPDKDTNASAKPRIRTQKVVKRRKKRSGYESDSTSYSSTDDEVMPSISGTRRKSSTDGSEDGLVPEASRPDRARRQVSDASYDEHTVEDAYNEYNGEHRLVIDFENLGTVVDPPERLGKKGIVPDGLAGSFIMYAERWYFQIKYLPAIEGESSIAGMKHRCIEWKIKNDAWTDFHSVTESREDALRRNHRGVSLCNRAFTDAMEMRAKEFEQLLRDERAKPEPDPAHVAFLESRISVFRPKRFSEGPLLFGLRHKVVQKRAATEIAS